MIEGWSPPGRAAAVATPEPAEDGAACGSGRIEVLVCTFRRPQLTATLESLAAQALPAGVTMGVTVVDNDDQPTARAVVEALAATFPAPLAYVHAPARNISVARNAGLDAARAAWVAFLDDDEVAPEGWLAALLAQARASGADAVFGPVLARYPADAPAWMVRLDLHSTRPARRAGVIETGYAGNALLRWGEAPWSGLRFERSLGQTGGEDTAFFFAAHRLGARLDEAPLAEVHEPVSPERMSFRWLARRRFRMGQSYAASCLASKGRLAMMAAASAKGALCGLGALAAWPWSERRHFWALRGLLHMGVVAGCLSVPAARSYGV